MAGELLALNCGYDEFVCLSCPLNHGIDGEPWRDYKALTVARNALQSAEVSVDNLEEQGISDSDIREIQGCIELSRAD